MIGSRTEGAARLFRAVGVVQATKKAGAKTHRPSSSSPVHQCQYIRGQGHQVMAAIASGRSLPALSSNADGRYMGDHCGEIKVCPYEECNVAAALR
jgi:hypothetical protein